MDQETGFPIGNFGIAGEVSPDGRMLPRVMYNPPVLGPWLQELGSGGFSFSCDGVCVRDGDFADARVNRLYPEARVELRDPRMDGLAIRVSFLTPIKALDAFVCSIPAICADIELVNSMDRQREVAVGFDFRRALAGGPDTMLCFDGAASVDGTDDRLAVRADLILPALGSVRLRFVLICHDPNGYYAVRCSTIGELAQWVLVNWDRLEADRAELIGLLPRTHDEQVNTYLRWYLSAGVLLTRITRDHVLTLGYTELNQRDSYWTSWPHLVLWPDLELRMIEESSEHQRPDGKIPTTILPTIEREDDIDINCYFSLRIARYYEWTRDIGFLKRLWPAFRRSLAYLKGMDRDSDGLVDQGSFWGDWKDVIGVEGRKAAPHFEFLWLAVIKYANEFAQILNDSAAIDEYSSLYESARKAVNGHLTDGGLWNGRFYTTRWYDGREDDHCQQDQCVGPLYGVVPEERVASVYCSIDKGMTDWGIRDTWPYRHPFNNVGGDYHNGGVWVFLNFADALSRFVSGHPSNAWEIIKRVGHWDLEKWGDFMPAEYLDGNTGANAGKPIQGWDACLFGTVLFGILGVRVLESNKVEVMPRILHTQNYETPLALPSGVMHLKQTGGERSATVELRSGLQTPTVVRLGVMTSLSAEGATRQTVGQSEFSVVEFVIAPGGTKRLEFR